MKRFNFKVSIIYIVLILYILIKFIFNLDKYNLFNYIINPFIWIILVLITIKLLQNNNQHIKDKIGKKQTLFIISIIYLMIYFSTGLFFGFENSPYAKSFFAIIKNIWAFISIIILQEKIRSILLNYTSKKIRYIIIVTIIFILLNIDFNSLITNSSSFQLLFKYLFGTIIPLCVSHILFTYITLNCGFKGLLFFRLPIEISYFILPIFPRLDWFISAIFSFIFYFIVFLIINYEYGLKDVSKRDKKNNNPISYILFFILIIVFVVFVMGGFKYKPLAVVSNSMIPIFERGDLVVVKKLTKEDIHKLQINDIIEYRLDNHIVVHRIVKIEEVKGKLYFQTKGDNNNAVDTKYVEEENVLGTVELMIPKIGYPTVWLTELFNDDKPDVEMGVK